MTDEAPTLTRTLLAAPFHEDSRTALLVLGEKGLHHRWRRENHLNITDDIRALNPAGRLPILLEDQGGETVVICETRSLLPYVEDITPNAPLHPPTPLGRAEMWRLINWFEVSFAQQVGQTLVYEKIDKALGKMGPPDAQAMRLGLYELRGHLEYLGWLLDRRHWLVGDHMTLADLVGAAHLSLVDYLGDVPWSQAPLVKEWYARLKQRPCFRPLLDVQVPGLPPVPEYYDLDF